ncbi:choline/carnitine O-acyltransferase [Erysipelotrichaceae bacterium OttesenSCG-928-M19]|nr:choline/carnitine O-acyltransferase [Erysipelotrichaceae bacterium OttesenSCG-928-M19]
MKNSLNLEQLNLCSLEETREWYLDGLQPLVNQDEYQQAIKAIDKFIEDEGKLLHEKLVAYKEAIYPDSWLMPYSKDIYLNGRGPVAIDGNYLLETLPYQKEIDYLNFVTRVIISIQDLYYDLSKKAIPQMKVKDQLLCMKQLKGFLRGTRVFSPNKDIYNIYEDFKDVNSCALFYQNNCYIVKLFNEDKTRIASDKIYSQIVKIYEYEQANPELSFTCLAFNNHDDSYEILSTNKQNQAQLARLNRTIFAMTLWDKKSSEVSTNQKSYYDASNAWPLKSWNIDIFTDLVCTFNNEHTFVDGATNANLIVALFDKIEQHDEIFDENDYQELPLDKLEFDLNQDVLEKIKRNYQNRTEQLSSLRFEYDKLDLKKIREHKINIDALFQLGFLYADYYAFSQLKTIHESVSASHFYDGRTSMLRSISNEGVNFIKALKQGDNNSLELLKEASAKHVYGIKKAKEFCCIARHYAGLSLMSDKQLSIYKNKEFQKYIAQEICTSSMGNTKLINRFAYAPVVDGGLGLGYLSQGNKLIADISFYIKDEKEVLKFYQYLFEYFDKVNELVKA